jgi:hypothetical protein
MTAQKLSLQNLSHFGTPQPYTSTSAATPWFDARRLNLKTRDGHARTWWRAIPQRTANTSSGACGACVSAWRALRIQDRIRRRTSARELE